MSTPAPETGNMIAQGLLPELDRELANTRKALERIPDDKFGWKPHERSNNFGWLAGHLATLPMWGVMTIDRDDIDVAPAEGGMQFPKPATCEEVLAIFDKNAADFRAAVERTNDATMMKPWTLLMTGKTVWTMPKIAVLRGMVMNHLIHHRGQFTVYLRLNDIPVPALYGPSADEGSM